MSPGSISGTVPRPATSPPPGNAGADPPLKDVLVELWQNLEKLVRQEIALASVELDIKAKNLKAELTAVAIGAALLLAGSLALVATVVLLLDLVMPAWAASLITGAVAAGAGFTLIKRHKPSVADVKPERTIQNLEQDLHTFTEPSK
ncbi:MAG TPA: phage holin family protein [Polyangiaceae bacterium]|nr:phage holin family protein [Polyangiaceae bacterium]